jgi:hypothetical protein
VMFEGGGANRFTDLTSTNHSNPGGGVSASIRDADVGTEPADPECAELKAQNDAFRGDHNNKVIKKNPEDGTETTFEQSGTVCHGKFSAGGKSSSFMGSSATGELQRAGVEGQCQPVSTTGIAEFRAGADSSNARFSKIENRAYRPPPTEGPDKRSKRAKKETVVHVKMDFCDGKCTHPTGGLEAHAELNILNCVARRQAAGELPKAGAKLLLAVSWNHDGQKDDAFPCKNCEKAIKCICENACIELEFCSKKGRKVPACGEDGQPKKKGRKR